MIRKRWKRGGALLLALALVLSGMGFLETRAAVAVDDTQDFSLTVNVAELYTLVEGEENPYQLSTGDMYEPDLSGMMEKVSVRLYKVADIEPSGKYTFIEDFNGVSGLDADQINADTKAEQWLDMAEVTEEVVNAKDIDPLNIQFDKEDYSFIYEKSDGLELGLYLILVDPVSTDHYTYSFAPYLVSVPGNNYYEDETDDWIYDVEVGLKVEQTPRYGSLVINKDLTGFNATYGDNAIFVYEVEILTLEEQAKQPEQQTAETRIVTLEFSAAGTDSVTIEDIPAGAQVTVTEVYSGAGYQTVGNDAVEVTIIADGEEDSPVSVSFVNEPDNTFTGGYGAINHFSLDNTGLYQPSRLDAAGRVPAE